MSEQAAVSKGPVGTLGERVLIVPMAHTELGDVSFQLEMYELFHRTPGGRIGHMIGTPTILFGLFLLVSRIPGVGAGLVAGALITAIAAWGLVIDRLTGAVTLALCTGLGLGALAAGASLGAQAIVVGIALAVAGCLVQTLSHLFEHVPPPQSGTTEFVPVRTWLRGIGVVDALRSALLTFAVFFWLELWATLRIWPIQVLHVLMRVGHRRALRRALEERVAEILADPAADWKRPRVRGAA
jgi:hypothetical protein